MKERPLFYLADFLATGFYSGKIPFMPGTFGTIAGLILCYLCHCFITSNQFFLAIFFTFFVGLWSSKQLIQSTHNSDPSCVVIDEIVGIMIVIYPFIHLSFSWKAWGSYFIVFRFFDIIKPFPIKLVDSYFKKKQKTNLQAFGVMIDDVIAAIYTLFIIYLLKWNFLLNS